MAGAFSSAFSSAFDIGSAAVVEDRGDIGPSRGGRKKRPPAYEQQKRLYYRQLQEELNRQLAEREEPEPVQAKAARPERRIVTQAVPPPEPVATPPMLAGEARRLIAQFLETQANMRRAAMDRALMKMAEDMARQQDEEDALAVLLAVI